MFAHALQLILYDYHNGQADGWGLQSGVFLANPMSFLFWVLYYVSSAKNHNGPKKELHCSVQVARRRARTVATIRAGTHAHPTCQPAALTLEPKGNVFGVGKLLCGHQIASTKVLQTPTGVANLHEGKRGSRSYCGRLHEGFCKDPGPPPRTHKGCTKGYAKAKRPHESTRTASCWPHQVVTSFVFHS